MMHVFLYWPCNEGGSTPSPSTLPTRQVDNFYGGDLANPSGLEEKMMLSVKDSARNRTFLILKEKLLPILRDVLMYQHNGLVSTALSLILRLNMMRSEVTSLLQEAQLLQSTEMADFYQKACSHAVRLQSFFNNNSNLRGQWCEAMLQELHWFTVRLTPGGQAPDSPMSTPLSAKLSLGYMARIPSDPPEQLDTSITLEENVAEIQVHRCFPVALLLCCFVVLC